MDRILLIDGLNFIHRGNITFNQIEKTEVSYTIVYNFFRNLRAAVEEFQPTKVFFCLESANCFRYKLFPGYKSNRIIKVSDDKTAAKLKSREDFNRQRDIIIDLLPNLPITIVNALEFEADDVIATLVENLKDEEVIIYSGDKDFTQLLQKDYPNLKLYSPNKKDYVSAPEWNHLTYLSLIGDKVDGIPSVVGPKKAEKLATDVNAFAEFLDSSEEKKANYALNLSLIKLVIVPDERLQFIEHNTNYDVLKARFAQMEFESILEDKYWDRFQKTFANLR